MQIRPFHNSSGCVKSQDLKCQGHWRAEAERQRLEVASEAGKWLLSPPKFNEEVSKVGEDTGQLCCLYCHLENDALSAVQLNLIIKVLCKNK